MLVPEVLYVWKTWSLILGQNNRLEVFESRVLMTLLGTRRKEDRVLMRLFGPKKDEVGGGRRELHNEEFRNLYSSPSIIRIIKLRRIRWEYI
jgi:hypothetical protein